MAEERVRRRLAAILAADVVGYSRLMRADEAGTLAQLTAIRNELLDPKIAEYGGRIVKTTGDGILVEFPSVVDAVQHAVDVQQAMAHRNADVPVDRRMNIRIGINVGDVIVEEDDLFGDGVNVAARLEGLAEPGGVCVSGSAHEQVRHKLDLAFEDMGAQSVKNIDQPVQAYRIRLDGADRGSAEAPGNTAAEVLERPAVAVLPFDNMSGDYEEAVNWARKAIQQNPDFLYPHFNLAAAYGQLGRLGEARDALAAGSRLQPCHPKEFFMGAWPFADPADMEVFLNGLTKAGVPEM